MRKILIFITLFIAIGAMVGTVMMWSDPSGNSWGGAPLLDIWLQHDEQSFFVFGLIELVTFKYI